MLIVLCGLTALVAAAPASAATIDEVASGKYWHKLLHYKKSFPFGKLRSLVDGPDFFFAPDGKTNPRAELAATVEAFSKDIKVGRLKQHPQCAFPERYRYLKKELNLSTKDVPCEKLDEFLARFKAKSATLVFSSAYPNNPGSMFGHTFLRINSEPTGGKKLDLLDHGVSFAAVVGDDENGFAFAFLGLTGGYIGQFSMLPYYAKVNEYVNAESRDVWEYDLNITADETHRLLLHTWELETNSWFDYFFFDENCAYILLALLEVVKPEWEGISDFAIYVIPGETVKKVAQIPGAVTSVKFRPSLRKKMVQRFSALNSEQRAAFFDLITGKSTAEGASDSLVLDAVANYLHYVKQRDSGKLSDLHSGLLKTSLVRRSELGIVPEYSLPAIPEDTRPDQGHETYRLGTSGGMVSQGSLYFQELNFKFAFHDLLNKDAGYIRWSQIDFPGATVRYYPKTGVFNVEQITGLALTSIFPFTFLEKRPSWRFNFEYYSPKDYGCLTCHVGRGEGGAGLSLELGRPEYVASVLGLLNFEVGESLRKGFRFGPKLQSMLLLNPLSDLKLQLAHNLVTDLAQSDRQKAFHQFESNGSLALSQAWELRSGFAYWLPTTNAERKFHELRLTLNHYF